MGPQDMVFPIIAGNAHEPLVRSIDAEDIAVCQVRPGKRHGTALEQERTLFGRTAGLLQVLDGHIGRPDMGSRSSSSSVAASSMVNSPAWVRTR